MQLRQLELLAPAKNKEIGIAAIDCGADAVYIAGPKFGAREAAGNTVEDIAALATYAHMFGARVYVTVNTILYDEELSEAEKLINEIYLAGADALIVQDFGILKMKLPPIELHASTQTQVLNVEQAKVLEALGFTRIVLERQLSISEIRAIDKEVECELEAFIHGALCVCYSGRCYLSQYLSNRSANRGACIQACRSLYDLVDEDGRILAKNRNLLSLKDLKLDDHIADLAEAGVCSFKIEGRLKSISYVKNVVRYYREVIDAFIESNPGYRKSSYGRIHGGFESNLDATFNRGYTSFFIEGKKGSWNSGSAAKSMGEYLGKIEWMDEFSIRIATQKAISGGDGFAFVARNGEIIGSRVEKSDGNIAFLKSTKHLFLGQEVYRNYNNKFEKDLRVNMPQRLIDVEVVVGTSEITAVSESGCKVVHQIDGEFPLALKKDTALDNIKRQLGRRAGCYLFNVKNIDENSLRFYPASFLNQIRRDFAESLNRLMLENHSQSKVYQSAYAPSKRNVCGGKMNYLANCANHLAKHVYEDLGYDSVDQAYELSPKGGEELMRTRYCIKYELKMCPKNPMCKNGEYNKDLFLINNNNKLKLAFDCRHCEMIVFN